MLSEDIGMSRVVQSTSGFLAPLLTVAVVKCARFGAILLAYYYLHSQGLPVLSFVWWLLTLAAIILNVKYKPWQMRRSLEAVSDCDI